MQHRDLAPPAERAPADHPAVLQLGIAHPDVRIDHEDGRTAHSRLQRRAIAAGHLPRRPGVPARACEDRHPPDRLRHTLKL